MGLNIESLVFLQKGRKINSRNSNGLKRTRFALGEEWASKMEEEREGKR